MESKLIDAIQDIERVQYEFSYDLELLQNLVFSTLFLLSKLNGSHSFTMDDAKNLYRNSSIERVLRASERKLEFLKSNSEEVQGISASDTSIIPLKTKVGRYESNSITNNNQALSAHIQNLVSYLDSFNRLQANISKKFEQLSDRVAGPSLHPVPRVDKFGRLLRDSLSTLNKIYLYDHFSLDLAQKDLKVEFWSRFFSQIRRPLFSIFKKS